MAYDPQILRLATARLERRRSSREKEQEELKRKLFAREPRLADIDRQFRSTMAGIASAALRNGTDPGPALRAIRSRNLELRERQTALLRELGQPADALDGAPACAACGDSGWVGNRMCSCLKKLCAEEQLKELSRKLELSEQSFDTFSLDWYSDRPWPGEELSPRENMEFIRDFCRNYGVRFGKFVFKNLFFTGEPGLGKTFLSACIAREVAGAGFSVVYETAGELFARFEEKKFDRDPQGEADRAVKSCLGCDLLILDDLGSEFTSPLAQSSLYTLVNTRLTRGLATVISSNLTMGGVRERYSGQTASRLEGEYRVLRFYGEDIRLQRKALV